MGKKTTLISERTGKEFKVDEDECTILTYKDFAKSGYWGKQEQYKYFYEHPEELKDKTYKLFIKLSKQINRKAK